MKKLAMNFLKTADEKLRSIGKQQNQSATVVQTQNFTYVKHQHKQTDEPNNKQQQRIPQQHQRAPQQHSQPQEKQVRPQHQPVVAALSAPLQQEPIKTEKTDMAERAIAQRGRRERNYSNGARAAEELERSEIKRRSRSEGPNRRVRQSMDEREGRKKQTYDGGGRRQREESSDSEDSDRNRRLPIGCAAAANSDSDSDPVKWTKNPLVVRRVKRSEKIKQLEKRMSGGENGLNAKNRDSLTYFGNEDASSGSHGGGNSSSRDAGSSGKTSSKYQKLEEMRKRRINLAVTSDEEATPASRISRLRQRAIQSGLGDQTRTPMNIQMSDMFNRRNQWGEQPEPVVRPQPPQNFVSPPAVEPLKPAFNSPSSGFQRPAAPARPQYGPRMSPTSPQSKGFPSHPFVTQESQPSFLQNSRQSFQPVSKVIPSFNDPNRNSNPMNQSGQVKQVVQMTNQQTRTPKQAPARPPPPNISGARQSFYTIPEPHTAPTTRALYNSSPEVGIRRFTTQVRVPSADSVLDSTPRIMSTKGSNQIVPFGQSPRQTSRINPTPGQGYSHSANTSRTSPSQFNEVVELRLQTNRGERMKSQTKIPKKGASKSTDMLGNSEDSLDELIESNIQYLDSEIDKAKTKRNSVTNVARSSSLPDPRRLSGHGSAPSLHEQPSIQVQASTSIQFHVSLPTDSRHTGANAGAPVIQIAPSNAMEIQPSYGYEHQLRPQPELTARKHSYDGHTRLSRPNSEYYDRDDLSKSDSQLNAVAVVPSYLGNNLHPDQAYSRGCVSDMNLRSNVESSLQVPQMDKGMFSDVEYDIEVSERVKKWEKFMKVADGIGGSEKKNINLTPIQENNEGEANMLPSEVRKSVLLSKQTDLVPSYQKEVTYTPPPRQRPFSSDTSINRSAESGPPKLFSLETNTNRFFQVIQDPSAGPRLGVQSQSVSSIFHSPVSIKADNSFADAKEIRQQMIANRQPALPMNSGPMQAISQHSLSQTPSFDTPVQEETTPVMKRSANFTPSKDLAKRGSRYQEELDEITSVKTDSVVNLRRRFDTDSATMTEDDDQRSVSTASAKLRPSRISPTQKDSDSTDWSSVIPGYQNKIKESDVWSPNLESTQGVPVSIERVTARTLQTIPFSEDPFWKEIEEMTSFDPNSMAGHLSVSTSQVEPARSQHQVELTPPHSSTLPNQPRNNIMPPKERMQRSKSLYTPNITPLTINVDKTPSKAVTALDDVLDDISRSSMERKQMSPKKRAMEHEISASTASGISNAPGYMKSKQVGPQPAFTFEGGEFKFMKQDPQPVKKFDPGNHVKMRAEQVQSQPKQPLQFYQRQQQQQQQQQNRQSQMLQGSVNNYQLDPNLLKQKLLNTGLVVETDNEESNPSHFRGLPTSPPSSGHMPFNSSIPAYTSQFSHSTEAPLQSSGIFPSSFTSTEPVPVAPLKTNPLMTRSGPSALDDIQKALAPFRSTSYQPGPESLYGTAKFESFKDSGFDTTRGPSTKATGWTFQAKPFETQELRRPSEGSLSNTSTGRLQQVNDSMDDLKDLAQNVERRINVIKTKLQTADEQSLDSILSSLRKLTPETKSVDSEPTSFEDYYTTKKSKLSDALSELDRIYDSLELNSDELKGVPESRKYKPYRPSKSSDYILAPLPKSEHLRPMQTRISSVFIPGLKQRSKGDLDKDTESEFDIISKSFQAIVDDVNQTTDMISRAAEKNKSENTAPETQKQTFKITLKPGETSAPNIAASKALPVSNVIGVPATKSPPATAPKPQESKVKGGRFRSKIAFNDDDASIKKNRSKSVPGLDSNTADLLGAVIQDATSATTEAVPAAAAVGTTTKVTAAVVNTSASTPPLSRNRTRVRPVKDNKIIQDDRAARRDSFEKVLGMPPSPQPSPKVVRKIIYNNAVDLDMKIQPPQMFQDAPEEGAIETAPSQQQVSVKQQAQQLEDKFVYKPDADVNPASVSSPATQKKVPPPTAAKPGVRTEVSLPTTRAPSKIPVSITVPVPTKNDPNKGKKILQLNTNKTLMTDSSGSSGPTGTSSTASTASINLTPPVSEANQTKSLTIHPKLDLPDSGSTSGGGQKGKRKIGTGVALILDRFSSSEDKMKKVQSTRSAPDLSGSLNESEENEVGSEDKLATSETLSTKNKDAQSPRQSHVPQPTNDKSQLEKQGTKTKPQKSLIISAAEKKVVGVEAKASESGTSSPTPLSPRKPPQHPWARQTSDPDKQVSEATFETTVSASVGSPKAVSKIVRSVGASGYTTASEGPSTPMGVESPRQGMCSPTGVSRRVRPANRKIQTDTSGGRPHSFHELLSCFEGDPNRLMRLDRFRKCASADAVNYDALVSKVFRSEPDLSSNGAQDAAKGQGLNEVVFKFELKQKS